MNLSGRACRQLIRRHAEAIFIIAFILVDCFLSGWALTLGTVVAILYVFTPALRTLVTLTPIERITFIKAFVKTSKVHKLAFLLFWIYSSRFFVYSATSARLIPWDGAETGGPVLSISNALFAGAQAWAPLAFLASPIFIYLAGCLTTMILRSRLKATKQDPDLIRQRQWWSGASHFIFLTAFIASILSITLNTRGPSYMLSNWLLCSARDANLFCDANVQWQAGPLDGILSTTTPIPAPITEAPVVTTIPFTTIPLAPSATTPVAAPSTTPTATAPGTSSTTVSASSTTSPAAAPGTSSTQVSAPSTTPPVTSPITSDSKAPSPSKNIDLEKAQTVDVNSPDACAPRLQAVEPECADLVFADYFDVFILSATSIGLFVLLLPTTLKLNALLTSFCWRVVSLSSLQNTIEGFLEALRMPSRTLNFREAHPLLNNAARTLTWLLVCYAALFWLFGFSSGPIGNAIQNWMMASIVDARFAPAIDPPTWLFDPKLRVFLGSIVALYGTAPIAITAAVILPYAKPRKIILNADGLLFAQGPFLSLWGRQFRLWSDLKSMTVKTNKSTRSQQKAKFTLSFRSGGQLTFNNEQIASRDLRILMDSIDQHAVACSVHPEVVEVCRLLEEADRDKNASDGLTDTAIAGIPAQQFKSTIFIPFSPGEFLPGTQTRIIKQLSSKPLCAVYLARNEEGRMVTVKQFYLPEDTDETQALAKILNREYELLTQLDHPGIAKVLNSFTVEKSTYLVIEHRVGSDLRATVKEHGARSEGLTIAWARQICEIMTYLHGRQPAIVHRDLTPDNIIAGEDGQLRLIDFGAAREFLDGITGTMIGKHCYVAPEQLRGSANQKSDIYSFGCTLYFLMTGRDPIALSQSSPTSIMDCSPELDKLIRDCTEFDEQDRPHSFIDVLQRLNDLNKGIRIKLPASKVEAIV